MRPVSLSVARRAYLLLASSESEVAWTVVASEEAGYVTGQTLHVNGGMAMI